jgi:hypothetical protein
MTRPTNSEKIEIILQNQVIFAPKDQVLIAVH